MSNLQRTLILVTVLGVAGAIAVFIGRRPQIIVPHSKPMIAQGLPECPHSWSRSQDTVLRAVVGPSVSIPELHDCQRLVVAASATARPQFDSIAGVFANPLGAHYTNDSLQIPRPLALVYFPYGGSYEPLFLKTSLSCLWIQRNNLVLTAWVTPVTNAKDCLPRDVASTDRPVALTVRTHVPGPAKRPDAVYNVARWDWDPRTRTHFIGIRCGDEWCEVGVSGFGDSQSHVDASSETDTKYVGLRVKGHYDEQHLAEWVDGSITVGGNLGTIYPTQRLASLSSPTPPKGQWTQVAEMNMSPTAGPYETMLNLVGNDQPLTRGQQATLSLCLGDWSTCAPMPRRVVFDKTACKETSEGRWYARVERPGRDPQYYCVMYRAHPTGFTIPPVVRWRWRDDDETIWVRCAGGCCEVNVDDAISM